MRVELNLSRSRSVYQRHSLAWSVPLLIVGFALLVRIAFAIQLDWRRYRSLRQTADLELAQQDELSRREAALRQRLSEPQNLELMRSVDFVNGLIDEKRLSVAELTERLTALMPPEVRLTSLKAPDLTGQPLLHLVIESSGEAPVEAFLSQLEDSSDFADVTVTSQGFEEKENGAPVSISCTVRYLARPAQEANLPSAARAAAPAAVPAARVAPEAAPAARVGGATATAPQRSPAGARKAAK